MRLFPLIFKDCAWLPFFQRCTLSKSSHSFVTFLLLSVQHPMRDEMRIHWTSRLGNDARGKVFITGKLGDPRWQHKGGGLKILACCNGSSLLTRHTKADWHLYMTPESSIETFSDFYSFPRHFPDPTEQPEKNSQLSTYLSWEIFVMFGGGLEAIKC